MKISTLKESGKLMKFPKDKVLFRKGDSGKDMFIILDGVVSIYPNKYSKETVPLIILKNGDFFGEMALLEDFPRSTTAVVQEESLCLVISKEHFEKAIRNDPGFAIKIMQSLSNRLRLQTTRYAELEKAFTHPGVVPKKETAPENKEEKQDTISVLIGEDFDNFSIKVEEKPQLAFSEEYMMENFFPPGHILYNVPEPDSYKDFLLDTEKNCPACGSSFMASLTRHSKLNLEKIEDDFRIIYKNFDPLWYSIWTCPNCYYADFFEEFTKKMRINHQDEVLKRADLLRKIFLINKSRERTIDDVLNSYYQAIQSLLLKKEHSRDLAKIWIRLAWLYKDLGDLNMYEKAYLQAFSYYYENYYNGELSTPKEDQQLTYLLGIFYMKFNNLTEARKHFFKAIDKKKGDLRINEQAYDKIQDIKKAEKKIAE